MLINSNSKASITIHQQQQQQQQQGKKNNQIIYDRHINSKKLAEVNVSTFAFLFAEIVQYTQKKVTGIPDLEQKLGEIGHGIGLRACEVLFWRDKPGKRENKILQVLMFINNNLWKSMFGKVADSLEKATSTTSTTSTTNNTNNTTTTNNNNNNTNDEYMIIDNEPIVNKFISIPKDLSQLNCGAFMAGVIEGFLQSCSFSARVTAHSTPSTIHPLCTTFLIKFTTTTTNNNNSSYNNN